MVGAIRYNESLCEIILTDRGGAYLESTQSVSQHEESILPIAPARLVAVAPSERWLKTGVNRYQLRHHYFF